MLCSSQSKNTRGLTFCQLNLAQRETGGNRQVLHPDHVREAVFAWFRGRASPVDGWLPFLGLPVALKGTKRNTSRSRPQAVWASHQECERSPVLPVTAGGSGVTIPTSSLLLLCPAGTAAGDSCSNKHGQPPRGCSSAGIGACGSQNGSTAARAVAFRLRIAGLLYRSTH